MSYLLLTSVGQRRALTKWGCEVEIVVHLYEFLMKFIVFTYTVHSVRKIPQGLASSSVGCAEREVSCLSKGSPKLTPVLAFEARYNA